MNPITDETFWKQNTPVLTTGEAARLLHVHVNTLRRWASDGVIPSYRICARGDRRFRGKDIADFASTMVPGPDMIASPVDGVESKTPVQE